MRSLVTKCIMYCTHTKKDTLKNALNRNRVSLSPECTSSFSPQNVASRMTRPSLECSSAGPFIYADWSDALGESPATLWDLKVRLHYDLEAK